MNLDLGMPARDANKMWGSENLAFLYLDGPETYVHPALVRPAVVDDGNYGADCFAECGDPMLMGQILLVTDAGVQGETTGHLSCALRTGGVLMALEEAVELQEAAVGKHAGR